MRITIEILSTQARYDKMENFHAIIGAKILITHCHEVLFAVA
jgi:hypothetical protein